MGMSRKRLEREGLNPALFSSTTPPERQAMVKMGKETPGVFFQNKKSSSQPRTMAVIQRALACFRTDASLSMRVIVRQINWQKLS